MIYQTINENDFIEAFDAMDRRDNFSIPARRELFAYYDELSGGIGEGIVLDVIAVCCDWGEYTAEELWCEYAGRHGFERKLNGPELFEMIDAMRGETVVLFVSQHNKPRTYLVATH